ncbi:hypothetical protein [Pukyongiella litopenaei]|uniref:Uncharacterized protein n=1 Tax=Pukyongiella litopenaei TaxID=2605946 RepID=A0A2S0MKF4_9RHOB|nr:hypothetical protein [Pukyongiella litopenaei]AVO36346.1 hypothetical protein C6Y53_00550 [Pukyongiella litopenaei]
MISAEDLIAGAATEHAVDIPEALLPDADDRRVMLRPLTVRDLRLIARAARDNDDLSGALMVRQALVDPALSLDQIGALPAGLLQFLLSEVNRISGITATEAEVMDALEDPLVQASLLLSRELGWTPEEVGRLTLGETMLHVAALRGRGG